MNPLLSYIAPPLLGAFIGYMTNYVAIRMLFRPLKPWRLFGLRLPMTPGVIPAKRHELAENIGKMVGGHLLTSTDIGQAISAEGFQRDLRWLVEGRVEDILEKDLGPVADIIPERFRSYFEVGIKILRWRFLKHLHLYLDSDEFADSFSQTVAGHLDEFLKRDLDACLPEESRRHFYTVLESATTGFLAGDQVQEWISAYLSTTMENFLARGGCLNDLLPAAMQEPLLDRLEEETPQILKKFAALIEEPVMQDRIARGITAAVANFVSSLGPMAALVGNFISPESIDQKVRDYLADKGKDISDWLIDDTVQQKVAALLRDRASRFMNAPVTDLLARVSPEKIDQARDWLTGVIVSVLSSPETVKSLAGIMQQGFETQTDRALADILADLFGREGVDKGRTWTVNEIITIMRSPNVKRMIDALIVELIENKLLDQPVGPLSAFLPKEVQHGMSDYLVEQVSQLLIREVPGLVNSLNIRQIVTRKVDSLDLLQLEGLLLGIMEEQFKYINLFGGILGFLIGLANLFFLVRF